MASDSKCAASIDVRVFLRIARVKIGRYGRSTSRMFWTEHYEVLGDDSRVY